MENNVEHEICNNCKKEIPQPNYVMHTMHCARNITLCKICKEPVPKAEFPKHEKTCRKPIEPRPLPPPSKFERGSYYQSRKAVEDKKAEVRKERYMQKMEKLVDTGHSLKGNTNAYSRENSVDHIRDSSLDYGRDISNNYGRESARNFGREMPNSYGRQMSNSSGREMSNSYGREMTNSYGRELPKSYGRENSVDSSYKSKFSNNSNYNSTNSIRENGISNTRKSESQKEVNRVEENVAMPLPPLIKRSEPKSSGMLACKYCDLELPKLELEEHENYCGSRTDKCLECGELVMYKDKQVHMDSTHAGAKRKSGQVTAGWDSSTQRNDSATGTRERPNRAIRPFAEFDYDPMPYLPSTYQAPGGGARKKEGESYKEISRRLDCKTEYIRNILHDSAAITVPLRRSGTAPRNYFYHHDKGQAPQPPPYRRRNPPTELVIPCEFCNVPVPHEELIQHETGCRPDLARYNPRRRSSPEDDYYSEPSQASVDEEDLPCEFCGDMFPASQLYSHQIRCT